MSDEAQALEETLRALPSIVGTPPPFDPDSAPADPAALLVQWLHTAINAGLLEPHAMTLATVDHTGRPDARVLILKGIDRDGALVFATGDSSAKGQQLATDDRCAVAFHWIPLARAVRVRGRAARASRERSWADFVARGDDARVIALSGVQSAPLPRLEDQERLREQARARLAADPALVDAGWSVWRIHPDTLEFWQGEPHRDHLRLQYVRTQGHWTRRRLSP